MGQQLPVAADRRLPSAQRGKPLTQALVKDTRALKPVWQRGAEHRQFHVTARVMWLSVPVRSRARLQVTPAATRPSPVLLPPRGCPWALGRPRPPRSAGSGNTQGFLFMSETANVTRTCPSREREHCFRQPS